MIINCEQFSWNCRRVCFLMLRMVSQACFVHAHSLTTFSVAVFVSSAKNLLQLVRCFKSYMKVRTSMDCHFIFPCLFAWLSQCSFMRTFWPRLEMLKSLTSTWFPGELTLIELYHLHAKDAADQIDFILAGYSSICKNLIYIKR